MGEIDPFWAKWGSDESSGACVFYVVIQRTFRQLRNGRFSPNLVTVSRRRIRQDIFENFHFRGHLPPKSEIESRSTGTSIRAGHVPGHVMHCRDIYCLLQGPGTGREFGQLFSTTYGCRATGRQSCPIVGFCQLSDFGLFSL